eukprot:5952833-Pleurochrysis_carterae.AAC.1
MLASSLLLIPFHHFVKSEWPGRKGLLVIMRGAEALNAPLVIAVQGVACAVFGRCDLPSASTQLPFCD